MKKFAFALFAVLSATFLFSIPASAQSRPPVPTFNVTPNFVGTWTLGFSGGRIVDVNGVRQDLQYTELNVNFTGGGGGSDGSMSFGGDVVGHAGSSFNIFYNPATPRHLDAFMYIPEPSIGPGNQYFLQVNIRLFVSSDGSYLYGTMTATFYDNLNQTGNSTPTIEYHGDVFMSRQGARG